MIKRACLLFTLFSALVVVTNTAVGVAPARDASDFPQGTYTVGEFTIFFGDKGQFRVSKGEETLVEGEYTIEKDQITLIDKRGPLSCVEGAAKGTYRWKYETETLTFTKVDDPCPGRSDALAAQPWKRKK
ncbi:MAG: hypothetical protein LC794_06330 [Acidobacteria bacterium]|nr:hypothetical protein [Acidobacteriota bacterium]